MIEINAIYRIYLKNWILNNILQQFLFMNLYIFFKL